MFTPYLCTLQFLENIRFAYDKKKTILLDFFQVNIMFGSVFMAIFVSANPDFTLRKNVLKKISAKTRNFEMAVEFTISFEKGWGKLL